MAGRSTPSPWTMSPPPTRARSACWKWATGNLLVVVSSTAHRQYSRAPGRHRRRDHRRGRRAGGLVEAGNEVAEIAAAVAARLAQAPRPTAIFTLNNVLTLGTLKATAEFGLEIPDDISLLGFDDYDWMEVFRPSLSAIRQPVAEMAHAAWNRLASLPGPSPWRVPRRYATSGCPAASPGEARWRTSDVRIGRPPASRGAAAMTGRTEHHDLDPTSSARLASAAPLALTLDRQGMAADPPRSSPSSRSAAFRGSTPWRWASRRRARSWASTPR